MKLFLRTLIVFLGFGYTPQAKITDHIPPAVTDTAHACAEVFNGFTRFQAAEQSNQRHFSNPVAEAAATYIVGGVDTMVAPLEFATYALAVGLLRLDYGTVAEAIKVVNSEK